MKQDGVYRITAKRLNGETFKTVETTNSIRIISGHVLAKNGKIKEASERFSNPKNKGFFPLSAKVRRDAALHYSSDELLVPDFQRKVDILQTQWLAEDLLEYRNDFRLHGYYIDINAAYWNIASELFLSEETYNLGLGDKINRLPALGSLAATYNKTEYVNGEQVFNAKYKKEWGILFFAALNKCASIVMAVRRYFNKYVFGYWVDGLFIRTGDMDSRELLDDISHFIYTKYGLDVTTERISYWLGYEENYRSLQVKFFPADGKTTVKTFIFAYGAIGPRGKRENPENE